VHQIVEINCTTQDASNRNCSHVIMEKALGETQTLHAGHSNVEQKFFAPLQTPFPGVQDGQNLISWRWSLPSPTNPVWWKSMHAISSYHGNRPTPPMYCKPTDRTDNNTLCH